MTTEDRTPFITTYLPLAGWKAVMYTWTPAGEPGDYEGWEPECTSYCAFKTKAEAEAEAYAEQWAKEEECRYVPGTSPDVPASSKSVTDQLLEILGPNTVFIDLNKG